MGFTESEKLALDSGALVWMRNALAEPEVNLDDVFQDASDQDPPRLIVRTSDGVEHEASLVRQTREILVQQLDEWLTTGEVQIVINRFGIAFHTEMSGEVIPKLYTLGE